ncbi:MAG TPA: DegV family protein [Anaerolineae bacterium]|nr:DegV family protein [Anaerolineae bacterium]HQH38444.1 DegV family protein [Anaerolineae bacterium]
MEKVIVVTDSSATVPTALVKELDIRVVPILLHLDGRSYRDGIDLSPDEFYHLLRTGQYTPTTAAPSLGDFLRIYAAAAQESAGVVAIHLSSQLSVTYNLAVTASQLVDGTPIRVINSGTAAMAQGFVVLEAARAAAAGANLEEVVARAEEIAAKVHLYATLETLEYLQRGGRIGGAAAWAGGILQITPVLYVRHGHVEPLARPRTRPRAIQVMVDEMVRLVNDRPVHVAICQADAREEAEDLKQRVETLFNCTELYVTEFTPVMGAHTGPGLLGVAFYVD